MRNSTTKIAAFLCLCMIFGELSSPVKGQKVPVTTNLVGEFRSTTFEDSFTVLFGKENILVEDGNYTVRIALNNVSGAGFKSKRNYAYGFINAAIKLPRGYSAGVVTAFYTSNDDMYPNNHDELDFEFLGTVPGERHGLQTNIYLNGSVHTGREERLNLWFDPTAEYHNYSILWNQHQTVFFVDNIPIRRLMKNKYTLADYPTKPTSLYATIWDGSGWATDGGRYPVDYAKGPYEAFFTNFKLQGCEWHANQKWAACASSNETNQMMEVRDNYGLTPDQITGLEWVRKNYMIYSYCDDTQRYPKPLPECMS
ncbi:hypothetical protein O6H91_19G046400 [Diphasiastrum complanatum]|uniref:Uncharacterized protein n=1 Tax=Diphasiastrum complanatum TaxID=34168 RepID=A0ACC2AV01_DIPCM|nr:hypothetical protein O6H91_19G046400 [Diphasiastrum complanatum]